MCSTTAAALEEVTQWSVSAFTAADVLTYITTIAPGCCAFQARTSSAEIESASEQPASRSGMSTVLSGDRIEAVSAMKCTPQNTIVDCCAAAAWRDRPSESPT